MDELPLILLAILVLLIGPILGIWAFITTRRLSREHLDIRRELTDIRQRLNQLTGAGSGSAQSDKMPTSEGEGKVAETVADDIEDEAAEVIPEPESTNDAPDQDAEEDDAPDAEEEVEEVQIAAAESHQDEYVAQEINETEDQVKAKPPQLDTESTIGGKLSIWIGGITLAIGGLYLVKYAIDNSILGPGARVTLGFIFGALVAAAGEWTRRRPERFSVAGFEKANIPAVLTGAGIFIMFGAVYAAHALYGLIGPTFSFVLLAILALGSMFAAILHGPILATIGLFASYIVPFLINSDAANPVVLACYVLLVSSAALYIAWYRGWLWFAILVAAALFLYAIALEVRFGEDHVLLMDAYLIAAFALLAYTFVVSIYERKPGLETPHDKPALIVLTFILLPWFFHNGWEQPVQLEFFEMVLLFALPMGLAFYYSSVRLLVFIPASLGVLRFASMQVSQMIDMVEIERNYLNSGMDLKSSGDYAKYLAQQSMGNIRSSTYVAIGVVTIAALLAATGLLAEKTRARFTLVATAAASSIAIFMIIYIRTDGASQAIQFGLAGLILFAAFHAQANWLHRRIEPDKKARDGAIASSLIGSLVSLGIIISILLDGIGLTIALGLIFAATAVTYIRYPIWGLRVFAVLSLLPYAGRLVWDPFINSEAIVDAMPIFNIILLGYGVPLIGLAAGAYIFTKDKNDLWAQISQAATIILAIIMVAILSLHVIDPSMEFNTFSQQLAATATMVMVGGAFSLGLMRVQISGSEGLFRLMAEGVGIFGMIMGILGLFLAYNPMLSVFSPYSVKFSGYVFNLIGYAYGLPCLLFAVISWYGRERRSKLYRYLAFALSALAFICWVNFTIHHLFNPDNFVTGRVSQSEQYTYSIVWLLIGIAALFMGIRWRVLLWRKLSAIIIVIVVLKVFLVDMSNLTGILRAISFIGLGGVLMGIGFVYQRALRDMLTTADDKDDGEETAQVDDVDQQDNEKGPEPEEGTNPDK